MSGVITIYFILDGSISSFGNVFNQIKHIHRWVAMRFDEVAFEIFTINLRTNNGTPIICEKINVTTSGFEINKGTPSICERLNGQFLLVRKLMDIVCF